MAVLIVWIASLVAVPAQEDRVQRILERIDRELKDSEARLATDIKRIIQSELEKTRVSAPKPPKPEKKSAFLGVTPDEMSDEERKTGGIKVAEVRGPAQQAGLKTGDILLSIGGTPVSEETIVKTLDAFKPGDEIEVSVRRDKKKLTLKVTLGQRDE